MKKLLALALAGGTMMAAMPATAAVFTPFTIDLSATDPTAATFSYNFQPGTYTVSLVKGAYTAFAPATPAPGNWTDYYKYSLDGLNYTYWNPIGGTRYATADDAFNAFSVQPQLNLSFTNATLVSFQVGDSLLSLGDNSGGTSLRVSAVPEPGTWAMMVLGFGAIGYGLRRGAATRTSFA